MLKLATEVFDWNHLSHYQADLFVIGSIEFGLYAPTNLHFDQLESAVIALSRVNKPVALRVDRIMQEDDLLLLEQYLHHCQLLHFDYVIYSDMAVYAILSELGFKGQLIFNAKTLNCSSQDARFYQSKGIDIVISHELPLDDLISISHVGNVCIEGYAHSLIFYSKRQLLSSYREKYQLTPLEGTSIFKMQERTTKGLYFGVENNDGTLIYNQQRYAIYQELPALHEAIFFFINPHFMKEEDLLAILSIYHKAITSQPTQAGYDSLLTYYPYTTSGFLYRKPLILEEGQNEKN
ncbi:MAG: U32 family peptidase [Bacilli bacterium]